MALTAGHRDILNLCVSEGFACLALAYWGTADTQTTMVEIPLERIERGLHWLLGRTTIVAGDGRAAVVGASRGGELALLLAATFPNLVGPVVAYTPSSVVWIGIDFTQAGRRGALELESSGAAFSVRSRFPRTWLRLSLNAACPCCRSSPPLSMIGTLLNGPPLRPSARTVPCSSCLAETIECGQQGGCAG